MYNEIRIDLQHYVLDKIIPEYNEFDAAHGPEHILQVIDKSVALARCFKADCEMAYTVAAYHDIGMKKSRVNHGYYSAKIMEEDIKLRQWFSEENCYIMMCAVEDHSTSAEREPRSLYGKIIYQADKTLDAEMIIRRAVLYGKAHYADYNFEQQAERVYQYINNKYGKNGKIKFWLDIPSEMAQLRNIQTMFRDKNYVYGICKKYYNKQSAQPDAVKGKRNDFKNKRGISKFL